MQRAFISISLLIFYGSYMRTGIADLPLHYGKAPKWLFERMQRLGGTVSKIIVDDYGPNELLKRLSDPYWFQAFACVLGFDWHSSGSTTTLCAALKLSLSLKEHGVVVCGGKGKASRRTPEEIIKTTGNEELVKTSRIVAKVDNACIQDGYQLYQHSFFISETGNWAVIQQGMAASGNARRYHWLSEGLKSLVIEPHTAICGDVKKRNVLDMTSKNSEEARKVSVDIVKDNPVHLEKYFNGQTSMKYLKLPKHHQVKKSDLSKRAWKVLYKAYELQPENYQELIAIRGLGPKTIRALALISELIYGAELSWKDPVKYSFAHGGKDGFPYPVNKAVYDKSISVLEEAIEKAKIGDKEKKNAVRRLKEFIT
mgnify:CR=1 FL=1